MVEPVKQAEQQYLDHVMEQLQVAKQAAEKKIQTAKRDIKSIDAQFNDIRMNTTTYSGMMDTALSVRAQQQMLNERENSWQHAADHLATLQRLEAKPYFARIDFEERPGQAAETIYIGLASFTDTPDHFLIYDWRAPISSIYYEGELGPVSYQTPDGEQSVNVTLKRQFQIEDGVIVTLYDTQATVTDQMLLAALSNHSSTKMKSIVATIQKAQNRIIRNTSADLLFVQGAAGSGKTAAVLQRVAWLLYRYRGNLTAAQVIMFSPNQLFNDYIDQVLPELGEHNMVQMTYFQYLNRRVPRLQVADLRERFEQESDVIEARANQLLTSLAFFKATGRYAKRLGTDGYLKFRPLKFGDRLFASKDKLKEIYYGFSSTYRLSNRLDGTTERLIRMLNSRLGNEMHAKWVEERVQSLSKEEMDTLLKNRPREFASDEAEYQFFAKQILRKEMAPLKRAIDHHRWLNINAQYIHLLRVVPHLVDLSKWHLTPAQWQTYVERQLAAFKAGKISAAGVSIYLYLYDLLTGKRGDSEMRFVFVDEVQDYDAYQLAYLKFCFPRAKFTLLGDLNQAIFTHENSRSLLKQLSTMFEPDKTQVVQLTKSYRSTAQITDFTAQILLDGEKIEAFDRQGPKPQVVVTADSARGVQAVQTALAQAQAAGEKVAIIGKSLADSEAITTALKAAGVKATLVRTENQRLVDGALVVPSYLAKGLEFDAVIVWDANATKYAGDDERQLLYTICSRAMHTLTLVAVGQPTALLDRVAPELYEIHPVD
ncbi:RNA polymerase recycling motor HelD [Limosilactobacillus ingluviei]